LMNSTADKPSGAPGRSATSRPSPGKGAVGSWIRTLLRSSPLLDSAFARLTYLSAAVRPSPVPLHREEGLRPLFIIGAGRSGNTLLRRILVAGGEIHIPPETYVLGTAISLFRRSQHLGWPQQVNLMLAQFEYHPNFDTFGIGLRQLALTSADIKADRRSLAILIDGFYRLHGQSVGSTAARWGDKTPLNVYSLERILSVFPDAAFVHMVRDGVDVAASYLRTGLIGGLDDAGLRWRTSVEAVEQFAERHPGRCLEVRYERLVIDPSTETRRVTDFAGLSFAPTMVDTLSHVDQLGDVMAQSHHSEVRRPVHSNAVGAGRRNLSETERQHLQRLIGPTLTRWSYPPASS
jgi:hypothetical protein